MTRNTNPPENLSQEAREWWGRIIKDYEIEDEAGLFLLQTALEAFDRMRAAQRQIEADGLTIKDRWDQLKPHPLIPAERDARSAFMAALKQMNLTFDPNMDLFGSKPRKAS